MSDIITTLDTIKQKVKAFNQEREWTQFHTPKNLAMAISVEAAELLELFLWIESADSQSVLEQKRTAVEHEVADIAIILLNFCQLYSINLSKAIEEKIKLNAQKYPVEKCKGRATKYTDL